MIAEMKRRLGAAEGSGGPSFSSLAADGLEHAPVAQRENRKSRSE